MTEITCDICTRFVPVHSLELHKLTCAKHLSRSLLSPSNICEFCQATLHDTHFCDGNSTVCEFCGATFLNISIVQHIDMCSNRTEECETCHQRVLLRNLQSHICQPANNRIHPSVISKSPSDIRAEIARGLLAKANFEIKAKNEKINKEIEKMAQGLEQLKLKDDFEWAHEKESKIMEMQIFGDEDLMEILGNYINQN